ARFPPFRRVSISANQGLPKPRPRPGTMIGGIEPAKEECRDRSEEHTSELQSLTNLVCRLLLEKKKIFRIRALGQKTGLITSWGGGALGIMRHRALLCALKVPQYAQMRPRTRQRMQRQHNRRA